MGAVTHAASMGTARYDVDDYRPTRLAATLRTGYGLFTVEPGVALVVPPDAAD